MASQGLIPLRGDWEYRMFDTTSTATFVKGSLVKFAATTFLLSEYSGGEGHIAGIALHNSADSLPAGKVLIAVPGNGAYARADLPTGVVASSLSPGVSVGFYKSGNTVSTVTFSYTSAAGRLAVISGGYNSTNSTVEVQFLNSYTVLNSALSQAIG